MASEKQRLIFTLGSVVDAFAFAGGVDGYRAEKATDNSAASSIPVGNEVGIKVTANCG